MIRTLYTPTFFTFEERVRHIKAGLLTYGSSYYLRLPGPFGQWLAAEFVPFTVAGPFPIHPLKAVHGIPF